MQAAIAEATGKDRPLRIAINCAGIGWAQRTVGRGGEPHDFGAFAKVVSVNLIGTFNVLRLAASAMSQTEPGEDGERGVVVNTASIAAYDGQIGQLAYAASKGGIVGMTLPAARDLAASACGSAPSPPGLVDTPLLGSLPEEARTALAAGIPFPKRLGRPPTSPSWRWRSSSTATSTVRSSGWTARCAWHRVDPRPPHLC